MSLDQRAIFVVEKGTWFLRSNDRMYEMVYFMKVASGHRIKKRMNAIIVKFMRASDREKRKNQWRRLEGVRECVMIESLNRVNLEVGHQSLQRTMLVRRTAFRPYVL